MTATATNDHAGAGEAAEASRGPVHSSANGSGLAPPKWVVKISLESKRVGRRAWEGTSDRDADPQVEDVIWPTWPATIQDETAVSASPLADLQQYWSTAGNRLRESAKLMATVLGAALAAVVGTSPLAALGSHHLHVRAAVIGFMGLVSLGVTMVLVLRVMKPPAVSLEEIQEAQPANGFGKLIPAWIYRHKKSSLYRWKWIVESHPDLYLPCGVDSVDELRAFIRLEEATLVALSLTKEDIARPDVDNLVGSAQTASAARLLELRTAAARITAIGEYYALRARSIQATYGGTTFGIAGTALIVLAFAWPLR
jgi:hypothetical protein